MKMLLKMILIHYFDTFRSHNDHINVRKRTLNATFVTEIVFGMELGGINRPLNIDSDR